MNFENLKIVSCELNPFWQRPWLKGVLEKRQRGWRRGCRGGDNVAANERNWQTGKGKAKENLL